MNYTQTLEYIKSFKTVQLNPGLHRITPLLDALGNPQNKLNVIHIAGTNGKGSVASMIAAVLNQNYKTGLFLSPYISDFRERIQINSAMIEKQALAEVCTKVRAQVESLNLALSQFEFITAAAFLYYLKEQCNFVVLETGLGGRFDATNTVEKPICTVLTKISMDHTALLGNTIQKIAYEKAGIIKPGVPLVSCRQLPEAEEVIKNTCSQVGTPEILADCALAEKQKIGLGYIEFLYKGEDYFVNLSGAHQIENAVLALEALKIAVPSVSKESVKTGLKSTKHPARMEIVQKNPPVIIDGAHNPDGAGVLLNYLKSINFSGNMIFGAMSDKDVNSIAKILAPAAKSIICVTVQSNPRALSANELKTIFSKYSKSVFAADDYIKALKMCSGEPLIICGSLYLASDIRPLFQNSL